MKTEILPVDIAKIHLTNAHHDSNYLTGDWNLVLEEDSVDAANLRRAASELQTSDIPVAFPTETVYGLGADATRSSAVQGIYKAKQRPSDNPLIVHVHSLQQLRALLQPSNYRDEHRQSKSQSINGAAANGTTQDEIAGEVIPTIYHSVIKRFWPGPLTLIMANPEQSVLAPEVTAGLQTFGVRMPRNPHALALLKLANVPLAAPSANASTKPSPTEAAHVMHDLNGRISTIIDGGPCEVGVESTVIDGLSIPPAVLRPGGVSIEELRSCSGWENVTIGYKDVSESNAKPRAPGMKYRHYSPKALVVLYEYGKSMPDAQEFVTFLGQNKSIGIIRTVSWPQACGLPITKTSNGVISSEERIVLLDGNSSAMHSGKATAPITKAHKFLVTLNSNLEAVELWEIDLESGPDRIARGLFAALRELDKLEVDAIFVEGVDDSRGDVSAAVMNRLRKAAEIKRR